ncbi:MAG: serine--tRNA ligase [Lactobacillales bacterium]|jgi:seryl-tRNA synthetase|nr:serine--tRNA ligase [Lactobacillales bacterium]
MLDIKFIRENPGIVQNAISNKNVAMDLDHLLELDKRVRDLKTRAQALLEYKNKLTAQIKDAPENADLREKSRNAGREYDMLAEALKTAEADLKELMYLVPNIPADFAPVGKNESDNKVIKVVGDKPVFDFPILDHVQLLEKNNWAEFGRITNVCGTRMYALKGNMVRYEFALYQFALNKLMQKGFMPLTVPAMAFEKAFYGTGFFPTEKENMYYLPADNLYLTGTAEVILNSIHEKEILKEEELPILYAGYAPCFRREAGAAGKDTRGLVRVHQFNKMEQYVLCQNDTRESDKWQAVLLNNIEEIIQDLELPYHIIECATGDMGVGKYRMQDIECWCPGQDKYREIGSCSTLHEWQARRTNVRYRDQKTDDVKFVHTLNCTGLVTPRLFVPLLENHQTKDGRIRIPKAMQPLMGQEYL